MLTDGAGVANGGHLTEGSQVMKMNPSGECPEHGPKVEGECIKWAEFKLPCSGSEWWAGVMTESYEYLSFTKQLIAGSSTRSGKLNEKSAVKTMDDALSKLSRGRDPDKYVRCSNNSCAFGFATNPLCVPAGAWKLAAPKLKAHNARTLLWKRTNLAKWASSIMLKGNESSGCTEHNIGSSTSEKAKKACEAAHIYFQPALFLNVITMVTCQSSMQERMMAVASQHVKPVRAFYELMQQDPDGEPRRVLKAMGIPNAVKKPEELMEGGKVKKSSESLEDKVDNFHEIKKELQQWDEELQMPDCSLHEMFTGKKPKLFATCDTAKLCSALYSRQELDWEIDAPPSMAWDYVKIKVNAEEYAKKHKSHRSKNGGFGKFFNQSADYMYGYGQFGTFKKFYKWTESLPAEAMEDPS